MNLFSQQDRLREFWKERNDSVDFHCSTHHPVLNNYLFNGGKIPSIEELDKLKSEELELYQTIVFHYYCKVYVNIDSTLHDYYNSNFPQLCGDDGIRGYLNFYEFNEFLETEKGKELLATFSIKRPCNYKLHVPEIHNISQNGIIDYLSSKTTASMVLYDNHSRVIFDLNTTKQVYDSRKEKFLGRSHILNLNKYLVKSQIKSIASPIKVEYIFAEPLL
jgi:hypothetical protein